jgi:PHD/YefM family antitoxin component YafN of YafNO toxin-antitoxin module
MAATNVQYVTDAQGNPTAVIVPIELWREIEAEQETAYLLKSPVMRDRLMQARQRTEGISLEDALAQLGI